MKIAVPLVLILLFFAFLGWWEVYRYQECKQVGHSTLYCILNIGK